MKNSHLFEGMTDEEIIKAMDDAGTPFFSDMSEDDIASAVPADIYGKMIDATIKRAKNGTGDIGAGKELIRMFCNAASSGASADPRLQRYIAECLWRVIADDEVDIKEALNIKALPNRPPDLNIRRRNIDIAMEVRRLVVENKEVKLTRRAPKRKTKQNIQNEVGQSYGLDSESVRKFEREHKNLLDMVDSISIESLFDEE